MSKTVTFKLRIKHWWQRNLGHVYLSENGATCYRFRTRKGYVALSWCHYPFVCYLCPKTHQVISTLKGTIGYQKPYGSWVWSYDPIGTVLGKGGEW